MNYISVQYESARNGYLVTRQSGQWYWSFRIPSIECTGRVYELLFAISAACRGTTDRVNYPEQRIINCFEELQTLRESIALNRSELFMGRRYAIARCRFIGDNVTMYAWVGRRENTLAAGTGYCVNAAITNCVRVLAYGPHGCMAVYSQQLVQNLQEHGITQLAIHTLPPTHPCRVGIETHLRLGTALPINQDWYSRQTLVQ